MNRFKRGLAALAVSLLALTGIAVASPAQAATVAQANALKGFPGATPKSSPTSRLAGPYWFYNQALQSAAPGVYQGAFSYIRVEKPYVDYTVDGGQGSHSLIEVAVQQGTGATRQAIEVGFTADKIVNGGSDNPHLFVGRWLNNSFGGYNSGGWVDNPANPINAGDPITSAIGTNKAFDIRYAGGSWYAFYDNVALGMFPGTIWSGAGVTFTSATLMQVFAEVATFSLTPCADMASGVLATPNGTMSRTTTWNVMPVATGAWTPGSLTVQTTPAVTAGVWAIHKYNPTHPSGTPSNTQTRLGGPGYNAAGTGPGTTGSC